MDQSQSNQSSVRLHVNSFLVAITTVAHSAAAWLLDWSRLGWPTRVRFGPGQYNVQDLYETKNINDRAAEDPCS